MEKMDLFKALLHGCKSLTASAEPATSKSDGECDGKKRFCDYALALSQAKLDQALCLCYTLYEAKTLNDEVAFRQAIKVFLSKRNASKKAA